MSKESVSDSQMSGSYDEEEYDSESEMLGDELPTNRQVDTKNLLNYESDDSDDDSEGMSDGEQVLGNQTLNKRRT